MDIAETIAERRICEAMEQGFFEDLPGKGARIADLDVRRQPGWFAERLVERERRRAADEA